MFGHCSKNHKPVVSDLLHYIDNVQFTTFAMLLKRTKSIKSKAVFKTNVDTKLFCYSKDIIRHVVKAWDSKTNFIKSNLWGTRGNCILPPPSSTMFKMCALMKCLAVFETSCASQACASLRLFFVDLNHQCACFLTILSMYHNYLCRW